VGKCWVNLDLTDENSTAIHHIHRLLTYALRASKNNDRLHVSGNLIMAPVSFLL
jgi:hypothetical protein